MEEENEVFILSISFASHNLSIYDDPYRNYYNVLQEIHWMMTMNYRKVFIL